MESERYDATARQIHDEEPGAGFWRRAGVFILSLLPIEGLL